MPQFDQFSFFNQVSWFLFFFFNFYFFITSFFLPQLCYNLKFRKKKIFFDLQKNQHINFERLNIYFFLNKSYTIFCSNFEFFISNNKVVYKQQEKIKLKKRPLFKNCFQKHINSFLLQKFVFFKKIFILT